MRRTTPNDIPLLTRDEEFWSMASTSGIRMVSCAAWAGAVYCAFVGHLPARGGESSYPVVGGFERFYQSAASDAVRGGLLLLAELNCVSCHAGDGATAVAEARQAPRLDHVGGRVRPEFLRALLENPQQAKPGTTMPAVDLGDGNERREQIEALVHYLASQGKWAESAPMKAAIQDGERLFHTVGCVACHDARTADHPHWSTSVPLPVLTQKYSIPSLAGFLENPLAVRPSGRMPHFNLSPGEARHMASFLLQDLDVPANLTFQYYEGNWERLPDFQKLPVKDSGRISGFDVNIGRPDHFGIRFEGTFQVEREGEYRFFLRSDDGSRLTIDGTVVAAIDGVHPPTQTNGVRTLVPGRHHVVVEYFDQGGGQELRVEYLGPGVPRQSLELAVVAPDSEPRRPVFRVDAVLAERGKQVFRTAGCADCHALGEENRPTAAHRARKVLELAPHGGCLSERPGTGIPDYSLAPRQREALSAALRALQGGATPLAGDRIELTLTTFQCVACHERKGWGGVEDARNAFFRSNEPEMGDEGRIPPQLTGVGDKLRGDWLKHVLQSGAKDRPYMLTRMPRFGDWNVGGLAAALAEEDRGTAAGDEPPDSLDRKVKSVGRRLVGDKGLSCVKCHTWGETRSAGIQAISLTTMTKRLRHDWFHRYLLDPQQFRRGTRMPSAWPNGQSPFPDILDGQPAAQIEAIWTYLLDGASANMPVGLVANPIELVPVKEPIIYRNFLADVGARAIAVGYPEGVHLAFDAEACRLALVWQGAFLDASMHWTGRGPGFQRPLGDNVLTFAAGVPLAVLNSREDPWPDGAARELGMQFSGYRLDTRQRPTFLYRWRGREAEETYEPVADPPSLGLRRTIRLAPANEGNVWFRLAVGDAIEADPRGGFLLGGEARLQVDAPGTSPVVRSSRGQQELLVPIPSGPLVISTLLTW